MISARCTRHWPRKGTRSGWDAHQRVSAAVHCRAPAQVEDLLARLDHGAVDDPRDDRRHLAGLDGNHDLVQQRHAKGRLAEQDPRSAKTEPGERDQVRVAEALADLGRLSEGGGGRRGVALDQALQPGREHQVALLDTVLLEVVEQPAGPGDPAATTGDLAPVEVAEGQPERAPDRSLHAAPAQELVMRARPGVGAVVVPPDQVGGRRQPLQVLRLERGLPVGGRQLRKRIRPRPTPVRRPAPIERIRRRHPPSPPPARSLPGRAVIGSPFLGHLTGPPSQVEGGQIWPTVTPFRSIPAVGRDLHDRLRDRTERGARWRARGRRAAHWSAKAQSPV
jgi:hypothetical protein